MPAVTAVTLMHAVRPRRARSAARINSAVSLQNNRILGAHIAMLLNQVLNQVLPSQNPLPLPDPRIIAVRNMPRPVYQLLDYEISLPGLPGVSGLNARKLAGLWGYESVSELCDTDGPSIPARAPRWKRTARQQGIIAHGGHLANGGGALLPAMAQLCKARGTTLTYHTPPLPKWLTEEPRGHLAAALSAGSLELIEHPDMASYHAARNAARAECKELGGHHFVPQGGAWLQAEPGVAALARSVVNWWRTRPGGGLDVPARAPEALRGLDVVIPAGSGVTALFLARHLDRQLGAQDPQRAVRVYAVPVNGDADVLQRRLVALDKALGEVGVLPRILKPPPTHAGKFGFVAAPLLGTWRRAAEAGVLLDLVYGAVAWGALEACEWAPRDQHGHGAEAAAADVLPEVGERDCLYINTGGHSGLEAQLRRYKRAGLLRKLEISALYGEHRWYEGQWDVPELVRDVKSLAAKRSGLVHTRDAGL